MPTVGESLEYVRQEIYLNDKLIHVLEKVAPEKKKPPWLSQCAESYSRPSTARSKVKTPSSLAGRPTTSGWRKVRTAS